VLDLSDIPGLKVDKHSTGGVGDKVSLCLAPLVAACGVKVPMISGRGLGHTGGTLDKLESIPGFRVDLSTAEYRARVRDVGACLIGQTSTLAPADKKLYALRDVTATVDCIPLIAASIMSKKLAEGIDALVLDVKVGSGAFIKSLDGARMLARTMIDIGTRMKRKVTALLTDMDQPLGRAVGNALEVREAISVLRGAGPADLTEVTLALGAEMLVLGGKASSPQDAHAALARAVESGAGLRKLEEITAAQGGDAAAVRDPDRLPQAALTRELGAPSDGYVAAIDSEGVGMAGVALGAGRERVDARIDPAVGFTLLKKVGDAVHRGEPLLRIHASDASRLEDVQERLLRAYRIASQRPPPRPLIVERMA
jgi:pyrimidine-nucleoside phosphorylase